MRPNPRIELHIEHLILDGVAIDVGQRDQLQAEIENHLTRLLEEGGLASMSGAAVPHVLGGSIHWSPDRPVTQLGQQIGQAVYQGLVPGQATAPTGMPGSGAK